MTMNDEQPKLEDVKSAIDSLERADRAMLRPWMLAHFDESGDQQRGYERPTR